MPVEQKVITQAREKEQQAAREIEALILAEVKDFDFPIMLVCASEEGHVAIYKGVWVSTAKSLEDKSEKEALILNPDGLFRAPIRGVFNYYNSIPSYLVPDITKLEHASTQDLLHFGRFSLEKLEE